MTKPTTLDSYIDEKIQNLRQEILNELGLGVDQKLSALRDEIIPPKAPEEQKPFVLTKTKIVVIGLWGAAINSLRPDSYKYLDLKFCRENNELTRLADKDALLIQLTMNSAHIPQGLTRLYKDLLHANGGMTSLKEMVATLDDQARLVNEDALDVERNQRKPIANPLPLSKKGNGYSSPEGYSLDIEHSKVNNQRINGRWVLRDPSENFMDCSYDLELLAQANNLQLQK